MICKHNVLLSQPIHPLAAVELCAFILVLHVATSCKVLLKPIYFIYVTWSVLADGFADPCRKKNVSVKSKETAGKKHQVDEMEWRLCLMVQHNSSLSLNAQILLKASQQVNA